jgi:hypothetical protein
MNNEPASALPDNQVALLRQYAAGETTWHALRDQGLDNYVPVLAGLGELRLRPPVAAMAGPNVEARERGRLIIRQALQRQARP